MFAASLQHGFDFWRGHIPASDQVVIARDDGDVPVPVVDAEQDLVPRKEGGNSRAELQAADAAAGAAIASKSAGKLNELSQSIADSSPTGNADLDRTLGKIVANVVAMGMGAVGGGSGVTAGSAVDRFNRQLHPDEYAMAKKDAKIVAQQLGISEQEAEGRIVAELLRSSDQQRFQKTHPVACMIMRSARSSDART